MVERPARRKKSSKSVEELKAEISARDEAKAQRAAARKKPKAMTSAEKYEQEKAARVNKGSSGYGYSQHLMGGSPSSSGFNPRTVREEVLVDYLLGEGFASNEKSAQAIIGAMSEEWRHSIMERVVITTTGEKAPKAVPSQMFPNAPRMGAERPFQEPFINPSGAPFKGASKSVKKDIKTA